MTSPDFILACLWMTWLAGWWLAALFAARPVARQSRASRLAHSALICAGGVVMIRHGLIPGILLRPLVPRRDWIAWAGLLIVVVGLGHTVWARAHLGRLWSGTVALMADHDLVRTGPYALTRHPIYSGLLLALAGTFVVRGTAADLGGVVLIGAGLVVKIHQEERLLTEHFGAAYRAYQAAVPAVVPRLAIVVGSLVFPKDKETT
jgi:protein-S-isoprenylcysteine O-methyltransferase Ste14